MATAAAAATTTTTAVSLEPQQQQQQQHYSPLLPRIIPASEALPLSSVYPVPPQFELDFPLEKYVYDDEEEEEHIAARQAAAVVVQL
jgi:hypothetical protein